MAGETNLNTLVNGMRPMLNKGDYVFCTLKDVSQIDREETLGEFKEREGTTVILDQRKADLLGLNYDYVASWITLQVHSALEAVGLTAIFSKALSDNNISCNVVAGYYHDHIFVDKRNAENALKVLNQLTKK